MANDLTRFNSLFTPVTESGCWLWMGATCPAGYGRFRYKGQSTPAYRAAYELFKSPIPKDLTVDHLCFVRSCVNPDHLQLATKQEMRAQAVQGWKKTSSEMKFCKRGHPLSDAYLNVSAGWVQRQCRKCQALTTKRYRLRLKLNGNHPER